MTGFEIKPATKTFAALAACHCMVDCFGGSWTMFKYKAGLDLETAGMFATVTLFITATLQPIFGMWADHGHQRLIVLLGTIITCLGMLFGTIWLQTQSPDHSQTFIYAQLFIVLLIVKFGQGMFHPAGAGVAGGLFREKRATAMSSFVAVGMVGFAFSQMFFAYAYDKLEGHTHWLMLPGFVVVLVASIWLKPTHQTHRRAIEWRQMFKAMHALRGKLLLLYVIQCLLAFTHMGLFFLMPEFLKARGYPEWLVNGGGWFLFVIGSVAFMVPVGLIADKMGRRRIMSVMTAASIGTFYLLVGPNHLPVWGLCLAALLAGITINTVNPVAVSFGQHLAPKHASLVSGLLMGLAWAVGSTAQWIMGVLAKTDLGIVGALKLLGIALVPAFALTLWLPKDTKVHGED